MAAHGSAEIPVFQEVMQQLGDEAPLGQTLDLIARRVSEVAAFNFCGIVLSDDRWERVHLGGSHGFPPHYAERLTGMHRAPVDDPAMADSPTQRAMRHARTVVLGDVLRDETFAPWRQLAVDYGYRSLVSVPLIVQGEVIGVLNGYSTEPRTLAGAELATVEALASQAALAVRLTRLVESQHETITTLQAVNEELERHRAVLERAHDIHIRLTDAVMAGAGFEAIARTLADLIGRPVAVADAAGQLVCTSEPDPDQALQEFFARTLADLPSGDARPSPPDPRPTGAVVGPIRIDTELLGHVVTQAGGDDSIELDVRAVEHAATVLALEIVKERVARATEERLRSDFLHDLINGREDVDERIAERARHYGLSLEHAHRVLVVELDDWGAYQDRRRLSEEGGRALRARVLRSIAATIAEQLPGSLLSQMGDVVIAAAPTDQLADAPDVLKGMLGEVRRRVSPVAPELGLSAGIGSPARAPGEFVASHAEAQQCLSVLRRLGRAGEAIAVEELGVLRLLLDSNQPEELAALAQRVLGPALERDRATNGALVQTLASYIDHGCDVQAAAAELFVHVNTVKYRLRRIEELCGVDLRAPHDMLQVTIAQLVLRLTA